MRIVSLKDDKNKNMILNNNKKNVCMCLSMRVSRLCSEEIAAFIDTTFGRKVYSLPLGILFLICYATFSNFSSFEAIFKH